MQSGGPVRKGGVSAEWTQELQAVDVIEVNDPSKEAAPKVALPRRGPPSASSIAPVGLDLPTRDLDEEASVSVVLRPAKRRRLRGIVVGALVGCALILVAAGIARVVHASDEDNSAARPTAAAAPAKTTDTSRAAAPATAAAAATTTTAAAAPAAVPTPTTASEGSTGTVRLDAPAKAGHVWLDGKKLSSSSALVGCGTHQVKVGRHKAHSIDIPCGGEIAVSK
jgi:hypothetical protein